MPTRRRCERHRARPFEADVVQSQAMELSATELLAMDGGFGSFGDFGCSRDGRPQIPECAPDSNKAAIRDRSHYTIPSSSAFSTARVRSLTPSLERMLETWFLTVPSATLSELAISLLL